MKRVIKAVLAASIIAISMNLTACDKGSIINEVAGVFNLNNNSITFDENEVDKSEVLSYESPYKDACTTYYKDSLNEEELELYKTFIYAYEHGNKHIRYYSNNSDLGESYKKVIQCLSAENPFIDWNQEYTSTYAAGCYEFSSSQLDKKDIDLKIQAYNKAKEVLLSMPQGISNYEKLNWIYSYVVNNISYVDDCNAYLSGSPSFIYDGLIKGKTQCTGFADTMTMMCNLAGIQSITICGETDEGHAWNLVNLDGSFYYCDATSDSEIRKELPQGISNLHLSFLKSEEVFKANGYSSMEDVLIDFPKAENKKYDNDKVDFNLQNLNNKSELTSIAKQLIDKKTYAVVHLQQQKISINNTLSIDSAAQEICDYISNNMTSNIYRYVTTQYLISEGSNDVVFFVSFE